MEIEQVKNPLSDDGTKNISAREAANQIDNGIRPVFDLNGPSSEAVERISVAHEQYPYLLRRSLGFQRRIRRG